MARSAVSKSEAPGIALRALRTRKGLTLAEVSRRTGLPVPSLSRVENGRISLTYDKLIKIAGALGVELSELFATGSPPAVKAPTGGRRSIERKGDGRVIDTGNYVYHYLATDLLNKGFVPILGEIRARSIDEFSELIRHPGEEFIYVIEGAIELHTDLYAPVRLECGDSIFFDSRMGHAYVAAAPGPCRILSICSHVEDPAPDAESADGPHRP